jgi:hypothetical protein
MPHTQPFKLIFRMCPVLKTSWSNSLLWGLDTASEACWVIVLGALDGSESTIRVGQSDKIGGTVPTLKVAGNWKNLLVRTIPQAPQSMQKSECRS